MSNDRKEYGAPVLRNLTGCWYPAADDDPAQAILLRVDGAGDDLVLPVFSTKQKLVDTMAGVASYAHMMRITDGKKFLQMVASSPNPLAGAGRVRVWLDIHECDGGLQFLEAVFPEQN
jgi:hypothetical protein